jgi:hypothetical protein
MKINVSDLMAGIALALSLCLAGIEIRRRMYKLHLRITGHEVLAGYKQSVFVLFHLTIVNPSSMPKIIYGIRFQPQEGFSFYEVPGEPNLVQSLTTFRPPHRIPGNLVQVRLEDTASFPLDIEPLHSKKVYLALALSPVSPAQSGNYKLRLYGHLVAFDYRMKDIAKVPILMPAFDVS